MFYFKKDEDMFMLKFLGFHVLGVNISKHKLLFSERNGYRNMLIFNGMNIQLIKKPSIHIGVITFPPIIWILDKILWACSKLPIEKTWWIVLWIVKHTPCNEEETK